VSFSAGIAAGLRSYTVLFGAFLLVPFFLERVRHYDPAGTGMISRPVPVVLTPTPLAEQASTDRDRRQLAVTAPTVIGADPRIHTGRLGA
jgi:hypothetical protein